MKRVESRELRVKSKGHTAWGQNARDFLTCHLPFVVCHDQKIHHTVGIGKKGAFPRHGGHLTVQARVANPAAHLLESVAVPHQPLHQYVGRLGQRYGQGRVPAPCVHDQTAMEAALGENPLTANLGRSHARTAGGSWRHAGLRPRRAESQAACRRRKHKTSAAGPPRRSPRQQRCVCPLGTPPCGHRETETSNKRDSRYTSSLHLTLLFRLQLPPSLRTAPLWHPILTRSASEETCCGRSLPRLRFGLVFRGPLVQSALSNQGSRPISDRYLRRSQCIVAA